MARSETGHNGESVDAFGRGRLLHSLAEQGRRFDTPELAIACEASDWPFANHPRTRLRLPELP